MRRWIGIAESKTAQAEVIRLVKLEGYSIAETSHRTGQSHSLDVVAHVIHEPAAWNTRDPLPARQRDLIFKRAHMSLNSNAPTVTYANPCIFRRNMVPHLVVQSPSGPVTVLVLTHESVSSPTHFEEQGRCAKRRAWASAP